MNRIYGTKVSCKHAVLASVVLAIAGIPVDALADPALTQLPVNEKVISGIATFNRNTANQL